MSAVAMDLTFITMHDLTQDACCVYASDSIQEVLGYAPDEVLGKKLFDYFHPDEMPLARSVHGRGVQLDRAAVLVYCRVRSKTGEYLSCECIFSVVYDVFVAATSLYRRTQKSRGRALTAPVIRRVFASSPHDPRYNMLTHLSNKFRSTPPNQHEPRAALILNRFTRSMTVLYSSHALVDITGIDSDAIIGRSFYEFIDEACLQNAVEAFERAKENDSIAYLRFRWRDPLSRGANVSTDADHNNLDGRETSTLNRDKGKRKRDDIDEEYMESGAEASGHRAVKRNRDVAPEDEIQEDQAPFGGNGTQSHRGSSLYPLPTNRADSEVEAVVSCTSDGLVVVLRRARPLIPKPFHGTSGPLFASPWARNPLLPALPAAQQAKDGKLSHSDFMDSIQQVAVFAWSLHSLGGEAVASQRRSSHDRTDWKEAHRVVRGSSCPPAVCEQNADGFE